MSDTASFDIASTKSLFDALLTRLNTIPTNGADTEEGRERIKRGLKSLEAKLGEALTALQPLMDGFSRDELGPEYEPLLDCVDSVDGKVTELKTSLEASRDVDAGDDKVTVLEDFVEADRGRKRTRDDR